MRLALEPDVVVIGEAEDGVTALALLTALQPDVVVMDVEMPGTDGVSITARLHAEDPRIAVVMLSVHEDAVLRRRALDAGAVAFVGKCEAVEALPVAIRQAALRVHGSNDGGGAVL